MRRRQGEGDNPTLSASSTLLSRPSDCSSAMIRQSTVSRSGFGIIRLIRGNTSILLPIIVHPEHSLQGHASVFRATFPPFRTWRRWMSDQSTINALLEAIDRYFDLMFDNDVSRFERVFAPSAHLHGLRDSALRLLPSAEYRSALASRPSPQSTGAPRLQEILFLDFASSSQAMAK